MNRAIYVHASSFERFKAELTFARDAGFRAVGVDVGPLGHKEEGLDLIKRCRLLMDEYGMVATQTHLDCYDPLLCSTVTDPERDASIRYGLRLTAALGAKAGVYHPRTAITKGYDWRISYEHNREALKPLLETAAKEGVAVAVENIPIFPDCPQHRFYSSDPDDLCELVDSFKDAPIGICWDTGHANLMSFDQPKVVRQLGSRIICTHVSSNFKEQDWHLLPLYGYLDWPKLMAAFRDIGYKSDLTLELRQVDVRAAASFNRLAFDAVTILADILSGKQEK
ncbi:MAG: sugar phosphate isomerase/epimerase [Clostridia bacterium]|nr:sugar phosphate isomerase/epimerase [Clostridia bacterium]